jgi:hypothetical protein
MNRIETTKAILDLGWEVLHQEPDVFSLVQSHWDAGNKLFDAIYQQDKQAVYDQIASGPWTNRQLRLFYEELLAIAKIMQDAFK